MDGSVSPGWTVYVWAAAAATGCVVVGAGVGVFAAAAVGAGVALAAGVAPLAAAGVALAAGVASFAAAVEFALGVPLGLVVAPALGVALALAPGVGLAFGAGVVLAAAVGLAFAAGLATVAAAGLDAGLGCTVPSVCGAALCGAAVCGAAGCAAAGAALETSLDSDGGPSTIPTTCGASGPSVRSHSNGACGGTWTGTSEAITSSAAVATAWLRVPIRLNTNWPGAASPGTTYDPPEAALPCVSVRKQLTCVPGVSCVRPTNAWTISLRAKPMA